MKRPANKFALIALGFSVIWIFIEHFLGLKSTRHNIGQYTNYLPIIIFSVVIFIVIYYERRSHGHTLTWMEGFRVGAIMSLIYAAGFTFEIILYNQYVNPDFCTSFKEFYMQQMQLQGATDDLIDAKMKVLDFAYGGSPLSYVTLFAFTFIWGAIVSAVSALVWMKKPKAIA
ncbi:MAG: DUF4199 domain-containing protein [Chitinophagales bacterium]|nr:DUF4199 domain-containing protein [Chitinophagales bacterium]